MQGCSVDASWLEIVRSPETGRYSTGGLGKRMVLDEYEVWLCDRHDACVRGMGGCMMAMQKELRHLEWCHPRSSHSWTR